MAKKSLNNVKDSYNIKYRRGSKVLRGNFYNRLHDNTHIFTLDTVRRALVPSETVCYICFQLEELYDENEDLNIFKITDYEHLDILDCLSPV